MEDKKATATRLTALFQQSPKTGYGLPCQRANSNSTPSPKTKVKQNKILIINNAHENAVYVEHKQSGARRKTATIGGEVHA